MIEKWHFVGAVFLIFVFEIIIISWVKLTRDEIKNMLIEINIKLSEIERG